MPWTERQHQLLEAMGVPLWGRPLAMPAEAPAAAPPTERARQDPVSPAPGAAWPAQATEPALQPTLQPGAGPAATPGAAPDAAGLAGLDWSGLRARVQACTACALHQSRRQTVFGTGPRHAHWLVVGEAPGEQEDRCGEPFVGPSGQLLDRMLAALGVSRSDADADAGAAPARLAYIANTLKCRPPGNRNPDSAELACCEPYLVRQIELLRPRVILAVGRFAVQALLRSDEPIGRLRGRVHRYQGLPLVVTYHPAYLLRNPVDKARAWDDLCLAAETLEAGA